MKKIFRLIVLLIAAYNQTVIAQSIEISKQLNENEISQNEILDCTEVNRDIMQYITTDNVVCSRDQVGIHFDMNRLNAIAKCYFSKPEIIDSIINKYNLPKSFIEKYGTTVMLLYVATPTAKPKILENFETRNFSAEKWDRIQTILEEYFAKKYIRKKAFSLADFKLMSGTYSKEDENYNDSLFAIRFIKISPNTKQLINSSIFFITNNSYTMGDTASLRFKDTASAIPFCFPDTLDKSIFEINSNDELCQSYINYLFLGSKFLPATIYKFNPDYYLSWYSYALNRAAFKDHNITNLEHLLGIGTGKNEKVLKIENKLTNTKLFYKRILNIGRLNFKDAWKYYNEEKPNKELSIKTFKTFSQYQFKQILFETALENSSDLQARGDIILKEFKVNKDSILNSIDKYYYQTEWLLLDFLEFMTNKKEVNDICKQIKTAHKGNEESFAENNIRSGWYKYLHYVYYVNSFDSSRKVENFDYFDPQKIANSFTYNKRLYTNLKVDVLNYAESEGIVASDEGIAPYLLEYCTYYILWQLKYNLKNSDLNNLKDIIIKVEQDAGTKNSTFFFLEKEILFSLKTKFFPELLVDSNLKDKEPPFIIVNSPEKRNYESYNRELLIKGFINDVSALKSTTINGIEIRVDPRNRSFTYEMELINGRNFLKIVSEDEFGNKVTYYDTITYVPQSSKNYAVFFATNNYLDKSYPHLNNPITDAIAIAKELNTNFGFDTSLVLDPEVAEVFKALKNTNTRNYNPNDQLFIFIAGHGDYDVENNLGAIVAKDSKKGLDNTQLSYAYLDDFLSKHKCKHIFLVIDVCYSGTFFKSIASRSGAADRGSVLLVNNEAEKQTFLASKLKYKTRIALTSSGKEPVSDGFEHSPFAKSFIDFLRKTEFNKAYSTGAISSSVENTAPYPKIGGFGNNESGSDFIFLRVK